MKSLGLWGPVAAWMALIFTVSSLQMPFGAGSVPDSVSHGAAYCALSLLFCRALAGGVRRSPAGVAVLATVLSTLYGVSDEWHQSYVPHRMAEGGDVVKDLGGSALGAALFHVLARRFAPQPRPTP